jgi:hypothetical protein
MQTQQARKTEYWTSSFRAISPRLAYFRSVRSGNDKNEVNSIVADICNSGATGARACSPLPQNNLRDSTRSQISRHLSLGIWRSPFASGCHSYNLNLQLTLAIKEYAVAAYKNERKSLCFLQCLFGILQLHVEMEFLWWMTGISNIASIRSIRSIHGVTSTNVTQKLEYKIRRT